jgi:putative ABC transport system permease protein
VKNAFRNVIRTASIVAILALTVALAVVMLLSRQAVQGRIRQVKGEIGTTVTVTPAGSRGFAGGGEPLTAQQISTITSTAHVQSVAETLVDQVRTEGTQSFDRRGATTTTTNATTNLQSPIQPGALGRRFGGDNGANPADNGTNPAGPGANQGGAAQGGTTPAFSLPISVTGTTDPMNTQVSGVNTFTITSGSTIDGTGNAATALVGKDLATKNGLSAGSTFTAYGQTITVAGIYDAGNTFTNAGIVMPLATVQNLSGQAGAVTTVLAKVDSISNVAPTTTSLQQELGSAADVVSDATNAQDTMSSLNSVATLSGYSLVGALVAGAVILFLSMLMIVRERRREIGVLKAIGASNSKISLQFIAEALTLTVTAALVGLLLGVVLSNPVLGVMVNNKSSQPTSAQVAAAGFARPGRAFPGAGGNGFAGGGQVAPGTNGGGNGGNGGAGTNANGFGGGRFRAGAIGRGVTQFSSALTGVRTSVGADVLAYGLLIALAIAVAGSAVPSYLIARVRPAEVMRSE